MDPSRWYLTLCLLIGTFISPSAAEAHSALSHFYAELHAQATRLAQTTTPVLGLRAGWERPRGMSFGAHVTLLLGKAQSIERPGTRTQSSRSVTLLGYAGPTAMYSRPLMGSLTLYGGSLLAVGFTDYTEQDRDGDLEVISGGESFMFGLAPELGVRWRPSPSLGVRVSSNVFGALSMAHGYFRIGPSIGSGLRVYL